jgi:hypothetical protein
MAETATPTKNSGGPYVAAALFCNSILEDSDGIVSALRIVDEIRVVINPNAPPDVPSKADPIEIPLFALIIIRRGDAPAGMHQLALAMETPDGKTEEVYKGEITMPDHPNGAAVIKSRVTLRLHSSGVFWIDVILGENRLTRMAMNLLIQRSEPAAAKR